MKTRWKGIALVMLLGLGLCFRCGAAAEEEDPHLKMGNPSGATADADKKDNYLLNKQYFSLSYNNKKGMPNWVSWRLTKDDLGTAPRKRLFDPDKDLPDGFIRITHKDYNKSGFDRGHMCPHSDRTKNKESSFATFVMTNVIPQAPEVNQGLWNDMEIYCRDLAQQGKTLYIVAGPAGVGGRGRLGMKIRIAGGKVTVPGKCWKVVLVLNRKEAVDETARVIAVVIPNDNHVIQDWPRFRVTLQDVEDLTGYKFFEKAFKDADADLVKALREEVDRVRITPADRPRR
jgi:endonuclease G